MKRTCSAETVIDAPAEAIWAVVCDVTRVGEWSGECRGCSWVGGVRAPIPGARFRGANRRSWLRWTRLNEIITVNEPVQLNWRTIPSGPYPDSVEWQIDLAPENGSTRVRESFTVLTMPRLMEWLLWAVVPAHRDRTHDLESDLKRLKNLAEHSRVTALFLDTLNNAAFAALAAGRRGRPRAGRPGRGRADRAPGPVTARRAWPPHYCSHSFWIGVQMLPVGQFSCPGGCGWGFEADLIPTHSPMMSRTRMIDPIPNPPIHRLPGRRRRSPR